MCKVLNKRVTGVPAEAVYIGRGSKWGNPFQIGLGGDRAADIAMHERWLADQHHLLRARRAARSRPRLLLRAALLPRPPPASTGQRQPRRADCAVARREGGGVMRGRGRPGGV